MFQQEFNGYKKSEVDAFIQSMRSSYETKLMAEKFKVLDAEKKLLDISSKRHEIEEKEQNIINVIERQKRYQEEGSKKIYGLLIDKLEILIEELKTKYPQYLLDKEYFDIVDELEKTISTYNSNLHKEKAITHPVNSENDSMRMLLNKMQSYKKTQEMPKEMHIKAEGFAKEKAKATYIPPQAIPNDDSGFSFQEALNPTEDLEEIMKAFDFYNDNKS